MTIGNLYQTLISGDHDPRVVTVVAAAVDFLKAATITAERLPRGAGQNAGQCSVLHAFRKRSGYYREGAVIGLDETIESLAAENGNVRLGVFETDHGAVALWLNDQDIVVGVMITRIVAAPS
jgi:hypothetical protein